jgi:hypothetical protein
MFIRTLLYTNTLPNRKDEEFDFDECYSQLRFRSKRTEEGRQKYFKTNALVPKNIQYEKRRGRYRSGVSPTFPQLAVRLSFVGQNGQRFHGNNFTGSSHKLPQMSQLRNAGDF